MLYKIKYNFEYIIICTQNYNVFHSYLSADYNNS